MPALRQISRSSRMALAVSAITIGWRAGGKVWRILRVASTPSISGIIISIKTTS